MIYKITDKNCEYYKLLIRQLEKEKEVRAFNKKLLEDNIPYKYDKFCGYDDNGYWRVKNVEQFFFNNPSEVDTIAWRQNKETGAFVPNKKRKEGKVFEKILHSQKYFSPFIILKILDIDFNGQFLLPVIWKIDDVIYLYLDEQHIPKGDCFTEITRKELNEALDKMPE